ncbi:MAG: GNAT family N-acetyltransferase [Candidatus Hodarchaeota archaeon]
MSTQEVIIRMMKEEDLDRIIEIDNKVLKESRPEYWERKVEMAGKKSPLPSLVAEIDEKVVGFIFGEASGWEYGVPENIGWIDTIGVDPVYQKKGIGGLLMKELLNYMKKVGVDTVYTLVNWRDWELLRFFNAIGFTRGDMINLEYKIDDG